MGLKAGKDMNYAKNNVVQHEEKKRKANSPSSGIPVMQVMRIGGS
jgi:hypothetical protein